MNATAEIAYRRWPGITGVVFETPMPRSVQIDGKTLVINGLHLTSPIDRKREAAMMAPSVPPAFDEVWLYGPALGDTVAELLSRPAIKKLHVVIMSRQATKVVWTRMPQPWLADARVELHLACDIDRVHFPGAVSPAELRMVDDDAIPLRDRLELELNREFNAFAQSRRVQYELQHIEQNRTFIEKDPSVKELFGNRLGQTAIVVAGGPSASKSYTWMMGKEYLRIVASTALKPLQAAGLISDIVIVADSMPEMLKHIEGANTDGTLIYVPMVSPEILRQWKGKRFMAYIQPDGDLFCGGSVVHAQVDLAVQMGATTVHLIGADFCYPGGQSHVAGAALPYDVESRTWMPHTINGNGERVYTDGALSAYRVHLEEYIARNPEVKFIKHGRDGVPLAGAEWFDE